MNTKAASLKTTSPITVISNPAEATNLQELLIAIRPEKGRWDMLAFIDGSGSTDKHAGGYAAVLVSRREAEPKLITGSASNCTSQNAEVRALYELSNYLVQVKCGYRSGGFHVHVITDSKYVESALTSINRDPIAAISMKSHRSQWISIQYAARVGIRLYPHYIARNSNPLMTLADTASKLARTMFAESEMQTLLAATVKNCNKSFSLYVHHPKCHKK